MTKRDLVPANKHHKLRSLDDFLNSRFDHYAREYGEFFQKEITRFEEKLESLKREIQLNSLAEKRTQSSSHAVTKP